jgi:hypothetical protein
MKYYLLAILAVLPNTAAAQAEAARTFNSIPFLSGVVNTANFAEALFNIAIAIAAILVVVRLIWAGSRYMLSGLVTGKESAKEDIKNAVLGLLIILGSVTILQTINPQLLNLNALGTLKSENLESLSTGVDGAYIVGDFSVGDSMTANDVVNFCSSQASHDELCRRRIEAALSEKCRAAGGVMEMKNDPVWGGSIFVYHCD